MESRNSALRTVDVARRAGCSVQQIRNLEQAGVLPPTTRTPAGYRTYTQVHALAAVAYVALTAGVGPIQAKTILRTAHRSPLPELLGALDAAHARLHDERQAVLLAQDVLTAISAEPINDPRADDTMTSPSSPARSAFAPPPCATGRTKDCSPQLARPPGGPAPTPRPTSEALASFNSYASPATESRLSASSCPRCEGTAGTATSRLPSPPGTTTSPIAPGQCFAQPPSWNR